VSDRRPRPGEALCDAAEIPAGEPRRYDREGASFIVARADKGVRVYANRCPHRGTELDWIPGRFLDPTGTHLQCATHGALFRIDDGECVAGPCRGRHLESAGFELREGWIVLDAE